MCVCNCVGFWVFVRGEGEEGLKLCKFFFEFVGGRRFERFFVVFVEVARVAVFALGYERRFHFLLVDGYPVGGGEPFVALDVVDAVLQVAKSFG